MWEEEREVPHRLFRLFTLRSAGFLLLRVCVAVSAGKTHLVVLTFSFSPFSGLTVQGNPPPRLKAPRASMDVRKWLWSVCAPLGLLLAGATGELSVLALPVHGHGARSKRNWAVGKADSGACCVDQTPAVS